MTGKRIEQLDGVRTLAIGAVFLHHAFHVKLLWAGVDLFFVLSGFLITGVLLGAKERGLRGYFGHFYGRRARRILPPYLVMLGLTSVFFGVGWLRQWYWYVFLMNFIVALQKVHPPPFEVLWSLAVEEQFYLLWPFVVFWLDEVAIGWVAGGLMVLAPVLRWVCTPWFRNHWAVYTLMPFRMDLLAAGALLAVIWRRRRGWVEGYGGWGLAAAGLAGLALIGLGRQPEFSTYANTREANVWVYELCLVGAVGIVAWALRGRGVGVLGWRPVRYVGRISYSIYLVHTLVLLVVGDWIGGWFGVLVAGGISVGYAAVSWRWFEEPLLRWRRGSGSVIRGSRTGMRSDARLPEAERLRGETGARYRV